MTASCAMRARWDGVRRACCASSRSSRSASRRRRHSSIRRAATRRRARTGCGRISSPRSRSPSGAATARCAIRRSRACAGQESVRRRARRASRAFQELAAMKTKSTAMTRTTTRRQRRPRRSPRAEASVAGIAISHPDKLYFPEAGITKRELAPYYVHIAPHLLPHIANRPLASCVVPTGGRAVLLPEERRQGRQRRGRAHPGSGSGGTATYMGATTPSALVALVQWGVIECTHGDRARRGSTVPID